MATVQGTGLAEEVYYGVDLAFRHLLIQQGQEVASTKIEIAEGLDYGSDWKSIMNTKFPMPKVLTQTQDYRASSNAKAGMVDARKLMMLVIGVASSCGFTIDDRKTSIAVFGPWKAHHGARIGVDANGVVSAYMIVAQEGSANSSQNFIIVKGTPTVLDGELHYPDQIAFSIATMKEYTKTAAFASTSNERQKLAEVLTIARRVGPVRFWYPRGRRG